MERTAWTDERLDDRFRRMEADNEHLRREIRDLRMSMIALRTEMTSDITALRYERRPRPRRAQIPRR